MEELLFLAHFPWLPQFAFIFYLSYTTQDHLLRDGMAHSGLGFSHISQESKNVHKPLIAGNIINAIPRLRCPLSIWLQFVSSSPKTDNTPVCLPTSGICRVEKVFYSFKGKSFLKMLP